MTTQLCCYSAKATTDNTYMNGCNCVPATFYKTKWCPGSVPGIIVYRPPIHYGGSLGAQLVFFTLQVLLSSYFIVSSSVNVFVYWPLQCDSFLMWTEPQFALM